MTVSVRLFLASVVLGVPYICLCLRIEIKAVVVFDYRRRRRGDRKRFFGYDGSYGR